MQEHNHRSEGKDKDSSVWLFQASKAQPIIFWKVVQSEETSVQWKPTPPQEPTDPDWNIGKTTQEGPTQNWLMTLAASTSTDKSLKDFDELMSSPRHTRRFLLPRQRPLSNDLPGIKDMVPNIWSPVKVAYDRYALCGISHWRQQRKFKEGDDVADFAITLRMFTKSLVIQKRVEDLQLGVESYQKRINVTKPDTTSLDLRKRHPYTPYKDPQGFIYVDDHKWNSILRRERWSNLEKRKRLISQSKASTSAERKGGEE
ncbi:hypothetical protein Tco_0939084 [Tanacetum coccineum]|uniref:Uncharacterized protein n=1 Tax=Tanacetum coccineum TaxID=301880 RepID=A0ABQ5DQY5_9ASTR